MSSMRMALGLGTRGSLGPIFNRARPTNTIRGPRVMAQASMSSSPDTVSKADMIQIVAAKAGTSKEVAKQVVESVLDTIVNAVAKDQKVIFTGFGSFERNVRAARKGRNPKTGEEMDLPEKAVPAFRAGKLFKDSVANSHKP